VLISLCQSCGACLRPYSAFFSLTMIKGWVETFRPAFRQGPIDIILIDLGIGKGSYHIQMIDVPAIISDQGDEIPKGGEFSDRGKSFSEVHLFVAFNYYACIVYYGAVWTVLRHVDPFGANWLDSQVRCFPGVDSSECVIEQDRCAFFFHCSLPVHQQNVF